MAIPRRRPARTNRRTVAADTVSIRAAASMVSRSGAITLPGGVCFYPPQGLPVVYCRELIGFSVLHG